MFGAHFARGEQEAEYLVEVPHLPWTVAVAASEFRKCAALSPYNPPMHVNLIPHPSTRSDAIDSFDVFIETDGNALALRYHISGNAKEILLPEPSPSDRQDGLWHHTCFELFARSAHGTRYCELNFSPSTQWAAYDFDDYRAGMKRLPYPATPQIHLTRDASHLSVAVDVNYDVVASVAGNEVRIALAAVVEERSGRKSYWAIAHPSPTPDFHHPDAFTLAMPPGVAR